MRGTLVTPPEPVVTLADAKLALHIDTADRDADVTRAVAAATAYIENWLSLALNPQTWELSEDDEFTFWGERLPLAPVISVDAVSYEVNGSPVTLDPDLYSVNLRTGYMNLTGSVALSDPRMTVRYTVGHADGVPEDLRGAVIRGAGVLLEGSDLASDPTVKALASLHRRFV